MFQLHHFGIESAGVRRFNAERAGFIRTPAGDLCALDSRCLPGDEGVLRIFAR